MVTLYRPDGVGLLRVIMAEEQSPDEKSTGEEFHGQLPGRTWAMAYGDRFIRTWVLSCRSQRLWIRYTCSAKNAELERAEVDEMLRGLSEAV